MYTKISTYLFSALILLFGISLDAKAQNKIWTGAVDSSWHTAGNWNPSGVPSSNQTVSIRGNTTPRPVITSNTTIRSLEINEWYTDPGDQLTIRNNATLTLSGDFTINGPGVLNIVNGHLIMNGNNGDKFRMNSATSVINVTNGSFIAAKDVTINGTFNLGNGTFEVPGKFEVASIGTFNAQNGTVTINKTATIKGIYNGGDGSTVFNDEVEVKVAEC